MTLHWWHRWARRMTSSSRGRGGRCRPRVEQLEERVMLDAAPPLTPSQRFVAQASENLLGHPPEPARLSLLAGVLDQGASRSQVVLDVLSSAEYRVKEVQDVHLALLGQPAGARELARDIRFLTAGGRLEQLEAAVLG